MLSPRLFRDFARANIPHACARGLAVRPRGRARLQRAFIPTAASHSFFVQRAAGGFVEVEVAAGASVAALVDAAATKLRIEAAPDCVDLTLSSAVGAPPLDPTLSIEDALASRALVPRAKLLVTVRAPPPPPLPDLAAFTNVLSRGPDAALDAHLLATLAAPDTDARERVRAFGLLVADVVRRDPDALSAALPLFDTVAHESLLEILVNHASNLAVGVFTGNNAMACRTLVGPRGIGKTVVLRAFCTIAASAFPSLVVLYVSGEGIKHASGGSSFYAADLATVSAAAASARGAKLLESRRPFALEHALRSAKKRVLLVLDEVDELYKVTAANGAAHNHVMSSLGVLAVMSGGMTGLFGVLACGSSASTHALICTNTEYLYDKFPLALEGPPDLNFTKFRRLSIETAPCSRSAEVVAILTAFGGRAALPDDIRPLARLLTFLVGVTPRAVLAAVEPGNASRTVGVNLCFASMRRKSLSPSAQALYGELLTRLGEANANLRSLTRAIDGSANIEALMDPACDWEGAVTPLAWCDVEAAWVTAAQQRNLPLADDGRFLARLVSDLADAHLVHLEIPNGGGGMRLWSTSAAQAVAIAGAPPASLLDLAASRLMPLRAFFREVAVKATVAVAASSLSP